MAYEEIVMQEGDMPVVPTPTEGGDDTTGDETPASEGVDEVGN